MKKLKFNIQMFATGFNNLINNNTNYDIVSGSDGNDTINNYGKYAYVYGYSGADVINNEAGGTKIYGGDGNDYIHNSTSSLYTINSSYGYVTLDGGEGNDSIYSYDPYVSINGGAGNDYLESGSWSRVTLKGGTGNDTFYSSSTLHSFLYQYAYGDGNDLITSWSSNDTINLGGAYYTSMTSGSNIVLGVGSGQITLGGANGKTVNITNGTLSVNGGQYITYVNSWSQIYGTSYGDTIYNSSSSGEYSKIYTYGGNDSIYFGNTNYITIDAGDGNDTIRGWYYGSKIDGGYGSDVISISGSSNTIDGGYGDDTITIYNGSSNTINGGAGNDRISLVSSSYATIKGGIGNDTFYNNSSVHSYLYQYANGDGNDLVTNWSSNDTINLGGAYYTKSVSNGNVILGVGSSSITLSGAADKTLHIANGILSITGGTTINNTNSNATIYGTSYNDTIRNTGAYSKIYAGADNDSIYNTSASHVTIDAGEGNDTIVNVYNNGGDYASINAGAGNDSVFTNWIYSSTIDGGAGNDSITVYRGASNSINGGAGDDRISLSSNQGTMTVRGGAGNDTIYGDTLNSVVYQYSSGDGTDYIYNFKDTDRLNISGSYSTTRSGTDLVYYVGNGMIYLKNNVVDTDIDTVIINNSNSNATIYGTSYNDTIRNTGAYSKIYAGADNDSIYNTSASHVTIDAGEGNDTIVNVYNNGGDYASINAGAGNDSVFTNWIYSSTIDGGAGNDSITVYRGASNSINGGAGDDRISLSSNQGTMTVRGGAGNDTIYGDTLNTYGVVYSYSSGEGNDVIHNFNKSRDTITGVISSVQSGNDAILRMQGEGSVTLTGVVISPFSEGNDSYANSTSNTVLNALAGNDTITNSATRVTINGNDGDDKISNSASSVVADGGTGNDSISNSATKVTIKGAAGADTVYNYDGDDSHIDLGDGHDSMYAVDNDNVTVNAGSGNDTVLGTFYSSKIYGAEGNDIMSINGGGSASNYANTIDGGAGNDSIVVSYGGSINGGSDNDTIRINSGTASYVRTVKGGTGNDVIYGSNAGTYGTLYEYAYNDGSDIIHNWNSNDTLSIAGNYQYTTLKSNGNFIVSVIGSGAITLDGASNKTVNIKGGSIIVNNSGTSIISSVSHVTLNGTGYNDTIQNIYKNGGGDYVLINGGAGNDTLYNNYGYYITMNGGDGNDTITTYRGSANSIDGGAGADVISLSSSLGLNAVKGGTGNDTIYGDTLNTYGVVYQYTYGDGSDIVYGHKNNDTVSIKNGAYMTVNSGNDVIINVTSGSNSSVATGAVTLKGASGHTLHIEGTKVNTGGGTPPTPTPTPSITQQEVIKKFMGVLDTVTSSGVSALNKAVSIASGGYFSNINAAFNQMVADCQNASSADDFLLNYCGINLSNTDTGAITGSDAGGSTTKTATSIVPEVGSINTNFTGNSFTVNGLTVQLAKTSGNNISNLSFSSLTSKQKYMWQGLYTWWLKGSFDLISESYGNNYGYNNYSSATLNKMFVEFYRENDNNLACVTSWYNPNTGITNQQRLRINMYYYDYVNTSDPNGSTDAQGAGYLDRTLAHELTHGVMFANIRYASDLSPLITEGMAELTHGIDDERKSGIQTLAGSPSLLRSALRVSNSYNNSTIWAADYVAGYMFLRWLAKQSSENGTYGSNSNMSSYVASSNNNASAANITTQRNVTVEGGVLTASSNFDEELIDLDMYSSTITKVDASKLNDGVMIIGNEHNNSLKSGKGDDTISGNNGNDTLVGNNGDDVLMGDAGNDLLKGDAGNDTLIGGSGKNTLTGGAGADVFVHNVGGNDLITDYTSGQDKIVISQEGFNFDASIRGSNVILNMNMGNITVKGGKDKELTIVDSAGEEIVKTYPETNLVVSTNNSAFINTGVSIKNSILSVNDDFNDTTIDLADYSTSVTKINATVASSALTIKGNSAANSIKGGSADDNLYGDAGKDTLFGGAGNDSIYGGTGNDKLSGDAGDDLLKGETGNDSLVGGAGNDTLIGGENNDTLTGGAGNDLFIYESGDDIITDYKSAEDKIQINDSAITGISVLGAHVIFKTDNGNLTVRDSKGKDITVIDYLGNETTQKYTGSSSSASSQMIEEMWFMDDNFAADDTQLDSISEVTDNNYSAGNIDTFDYNSLDYLQIASSDNQSLNNK